MQHGRLPVAREVNPKNGLPTCRTFQKKMKMSWGDFTLAKYPKLVEQREQRHRERAVSAKKEMTEYTTDMLITAVTEFAKEHGRLPEKEEYTPQNGLPGYMTFSHIASRLLTEYLEENLAAYLTPKNNAMDNGQEEETSGMSLTM